MAGLEVDFDEDFLSELFDGDIDNLCESMLNDAAPILEKAAQNECRKVIEHEGDSELVKSIKANKAKKTKNGAHIVNISPKGKSTKKHYISKTSARRKYPVSNALKAIWKEYGIPGQQAPHPFFQKASNHAKQEVLNRMQEVYNRRTGVK